LRKTSASAEGEKIVSHETQNFASLVRRVKGDEALNFDGILPLSPSLLFSEQIWSYMVPATVERLHLT
jgi:hypothetical protein